MIEQLKLMAEHAITMRVFNDDFDGLVVELRKGDMGHRMRVDTVRLGFYAAPDKLASDMLLEQITSFVQYAFNRQVIYPYPAPRTDVPGPDTLPPKDES